NRFRLRNRRCNSRLPLHAVSRVLQNARGQQRKTESRALTGQQNDGIKNRHEEVRGRVGRKRSTSDSSASSRQRRLVMSNKKTGAGCCACRRPKTVFGHGIVRADQSFLTTMLGNLDVMSLAFSATLIAILRAICL